jgi:hypothetical protein
MCDFFFDFDFDFFKLETARWLLRYAPLRVFTKKNPKKISKKNFKKFLKNFNFFFKILKTGLPKLLRMS